KHLFEEIVDQIEALHKLGIQHGDLHKGNILITRKSQKPYLIDFGKSSPLVTEFKDYKNLVVLPLLSQIYHHRLLQEKEEASKRSFKAFSPPLSIPSPMSRGRGGSLSPSTPTSRRKRGGSVEHRSRFDRSNSWSPRGRRGPSFPIPGSAESPNWRSPSS